MTYTPTLLCHRHGSQVELQEKNIGHNFCTNLTSDSCQDSFISLESILLYKSTIHVFNLLVTLYLDIYYKAPIFKEILLCHVWITKWLKMFLVHLHLKPLSHQSGVLTAFNKNLQNAKVHAVQTPATLCKRGAIA